MNLRNGRFLSKVSQVELQRRTGIQASRLSLIENQHVVPRPCEIEKIEKALGLRGGIQWNGPGSTAKSKIPASILNLIKSAQTKDKKSEFKE